MNQAQAEAPTFPLRRFGDITPKPIEYVVKGLIPVDSINWVIGPSGEGKTWTVATLACCIVTGKDFSAHPVQRSGPVIILTGEGFAGLVLRITAWATAHAVDLSEAPLYISEIAVDLSDATSIGGAIFAIEQIASIYGAPVLVVLDTLARNIGGANENDTKDAGMVQKALDRIRTTWGCAVLVVHHTGHQDRTRGRGNTSFRGAADTEYLVQMVNGTIVMTPTKTKDGKAPEPMAFRLRDIALRMLDEEGNRVSSAYLVSDAVPGPGALTDLDKKILAALKPGEQLGPKEIAMRIGHMENAVSKALANLVRLERISKVGRGKYEVSANLPGSSRQKAERREPNLLSASPYRGEQIADSLEEDFEEEEDHLPTAGGLGIF